MFLVELDVLRRRYPGHRVRHLLLQIVRRHRHQIDVALLAIGVRPFEPCTGGDRAETEIDANLGDVAEDPIFVGLGVAGDASRRLGAGRERHDIGRGDLRRRCRRIERDVVAAQCLVVIAIGIGAVLEHRTGRNIGLQLDDLEVGLLPRAVIAVEALAVRIVVEAEIAAILRHLAQRRAVLVGLVEAVLVIGAEQGQPHVRRDRHHDLAEHVVRLERAVGAGTVRSDVLAAHHHLGSAERVDRAALGDAAHQPGVERTIAALQFHPRLLARGAREEVDVAAERGLAELRRVARAAIDDQRLDRVRREEGVRMMGRVVGVAERHAVIGDVVLAVLEAADLRLGFRKARAVGVAITRHARRDQRDLIEVRGRRQRIFDEGAADDRLGLGRLEGSRDRSDFVGTGGGDDDVRPFGDIVRTRPGIVPGNGLRWRRFGLGGSGGGQDERCYATGRVKPEVVRRYLHLSSPWGLGEPDPASRTRSWKVMTV